MKLFHFGAAALTLGLSLSLVAVTGCGSSSPTTGGTTTTDTPKDTPAGKAKPMVAGKGVIKGVVTLEGAEPNTKTLTDELVAQDQGKVAER